MKGKLLKPFYSLFTVITMLFCGVNIASADVVGPVGALGRSLILILGLFCLVLAGIVIAIIVAIKKKNAK